MRILITGSSGQIGTNLGLSLLADGHDVIGVDRRANQWTDRLPTVQHDLATVVTPELATEWLNQQVGAPPAIVVHLAAHAKVHELTVNPQRSLENVIMTYNILEYCRLHRLPLILASSRETYGNLPPDNQPVSEDRADHTRAASPYAASKLASEAYVQCYARCYGLPYIIFRFSNVYGRYDNDIERMERVTPLFIRKISQHEPIVIYGEHKLLDFTYVDDCVAGVRLGIDALTSGKVNAATLNLAYGQGHSLIELANLIGEAVGVEPQMSIQPTLVGEVSRYVADLSRARQLLGYEPRTPLAEGIPLAVAWNNEWAAQSDKGTT